MGQVQLPLRSHVGCLSPSRLFSPKLLRIFTILLLLGCAHYAISGPAPASLTFQGLLRTLDTGGSITLSTSSSVVLDPAGDIFIADTGNSRIVEVNAQGVASVLTITGLTPALVTPTGIAIDGSGNLYITDADPSNSRVVKVTSAGVGSPISTGSVTLSSPKGVAVDKSGNIFVADTGHNQIVEVTSGGSAAALAITGLSSPTTLSAPKGLALDVSGNLYIADSTNNRIVTVAAGGTTGVVFSITGLSPALSGPSSVVVDRIGNLYIADTYNARVAEVDTTGAGYNFLSTLGNPELSNPQGVAIDSFGTVYIVNTGASPSQILIADPMLQGTSSGTLYSSSLNKSAVGFGHISLGSATSTALVLNFTVGTPVTTNLGSVSAFTTGTSGLDFQIVPGANTTCTIATTSGSCTVKVVFQPTAPGLRSGAVVLKDQDSNPVLTLPIYGWGDTPLAALNPNIGAVISTGTLAISNPYQTALDGAGNIYLGAYSSSQAVKIPTGGGSASAVTLGTPGTPATAVRNITGVALDGAGNLFIGDHQNSRILVVTPAGVVSVLNFTGLSSPLGFPTSLTFDGAGNLYIADFTNGLIIEVSSLKVTGSTSTGKAKVISTGSYTFGSGNLTGMTVDSMGNIYAAARTQNSSSIVKVTPAGVSSLLSIPNNITPAISNPQGVGVDAMGNVYIVDTTNSRIVRVTTAGVASPLGVSGLPSPATTLGPTLFGVTVDPVGNLYISDWTNNRLVFVNVSGAALKFPTATRQGSTDSTDGAKTATDANLGNQPLIFSTDPTYTLDFINNSGDTNPCTASTELSTGALCDVSVKFTPQSVGSLSAGITVTNNTLNVPGSTQSVAVSGTATNPGDTTSSVVTISPASLVSGQPATIAATVSDTTTGHTSTVPTGSVSFTDAVGTTLTTLNNGSAVTLSAGKATLSGVVLAGTGTHIITANYGGVSGTYLTSNNTTTATLAKASVTVTGPTQQPVMVTTGQTGSVTVTVTAPYTTISAPTGTLSYNVLNSSSTSVSSGTPTLVAGSSGSTASIPIPSTLAAGNYTVSVNYGGDNNYLANATATTIQVQVGQITPTLSWIPGASSIAYGTSLSGLLNATATSGTSPIPGTLVYTATPAGGTALTVTSASVLGAGVYTLSCTFTPADTNTYQVASAQSSLTVSKVTPTIAILSSINPVVVTSAVTFTATLSSSASTPTGSVSFYDGTTLLGAVALSNGVAAYTTSALAVATHSITAVYGGSANFASATSSAVALVVQDFVVSSTGSSGGSGGSGGSSDVPTQTVVPGQTATYSLALVPTNSSTTFPVPITMSVSGLPPGATATVTPQVIPANTVIPNITLSIQLPGSTASLSPKPALRRQLPLVLWGILLLPFARKLRGAGKRFGKGIALLLLLASGAAAMSGLSGCGSSNGFFGQPQHTYTVIVTATAGTVARSTSVTLTVE